MLLYIGTMCVPFAGELACADTVVAVVQFRYDKTLKGYEFPQCGKSEVRRGGPASNFLIRTILLAKSLRKRTHNIIYT